MKDELKIAIYMLGGMALAIAVAILMSGCASIKEQFKKAEELYNRVDPVVSYRITPAERGDFYNTNFKECTDEERVDMLIRDLIDDKADFEVLTRTYIDRRREVMWNGNVIYPTPALPGAYTESKIEVYRSGSKDKVNSREVIHEPHSVGIN